MDFEHYLLSKKIDSAAFREAEPQRWEDWFKEFEEVNENSFTAQKLYLINPIRRKYKLVNTPLTEKKPAVNEVPLPIVKQNTPDSQQQPTPAKPAVARPVFKPKPKMN